MHDAIDVVIPNVADFNLRHSRTELDPGTRARFVTVGQARADQGVFWSTGSRVLVLPSGVDDLWLSDVHDALGADVPPVVSPAVRSGLLVPDLLADHAAIKALRDHVRGYPRVSLRCWGATEDLYRLKAVLSSEGQEVDADIPDEDSFWASLYLESKQSCLDLAARIPGLRVVPPIVVDSWLELDGAVRAILTYAPAVIVRSRHGVGGEGSTVVQAGSNSREQLWTSVREDPLLRLFPLIVQEYVAHRPGLGCPAADLLISDDAGTPDGVAELVTSTIAVDTHRVVSVNVGSGLVPAAMEEELHELARRVARAARSIGYRGWFSVDFIADERDNLILTEFNARRTGGMHGIVLLDRWRGTSNVVAHSQDSVPVQSGGPIGYHDIRAAIAGRGHAIPAFLTTVRLLSGRRRSYGIVSGGPDAEQAQAHVGMLRGMIDERLGCS